MCWAPSGVTIQALLRPDAESMFLEAERRVEVRWPRLRAEVIGHIGLGGDPQCLRGPERQLTQCLRMAREGFAGVDSRVDPCENEAAPELWKVVSGMTERAADVDLGITVHAGEFSSAIPRPPCESPASSG